MGSGVLSTDDVGDGRPSVPGASLKLGLSILVLFEMREVDHRMHPV
jgi:hypothetical protein